MHYPSNFNFSFLFLWCLLWRKTVRCKCAGCCAAGARDDGGLMILASRISLAAFALPLALLFPPSSVAPAESNITPVVCQVLKQQATASGNYHANKVFFPCFLCVLQIYIKKTQTWHLTHSHCRSCDFIFLYFILYKAALRLVQLYISYSLHAASYNMWLVYSIVPWISIHPPLHLIWDCCRCHESTQNGS